MNDDLMSRTIVAFGEMVFRDSHADAIGESLAKRAGGRLHPRRHSALGVSRTLTPPLAELLDLFQRQIVARQMQQAVEQHRTVSSRQDKPVPIEPVRIGRI